MFYVGQKVARKIAPAKHLKIVAIRDGQYILTDDYGTPKGGAWANDLETR